MPNPGISRQPMAVRRPRAAVASFLRTAATTAAGVAAGALAFQGIESLMHGFGGGAAGLGGGGFFGGGRTAGRDRYQQLL